MIKFAPGLSRPRCGRWWQAVGGGTLITVERDKTGGNPRLGLARTARPVSRRSSPRFPLTTTSSITAAFTGPSPPRGGLATAVRRLDRMVQADKIVAREIRLVRADGRPAAVFATIERADVTLRFYCGKGEQVLQIGVASSGMPETRLEDVQSPPCRLQSETVPLFQPARSTTGGEHCRRRTVHHQ